MDSKLVDEANEFLREVGVMDIHSNVDYRTAGVLRNQLHRFTKTNHLSSSSVAGRICLAATKRLNVKRNAYSDILKEGGGTT